MTGREAMSRDELAAKQEALLADLKTARQALKWATKHAAEIDYDGVEMAARSAAEDIGEFIDNADNWAVDLHN